VNEVPPGSIERLEPPERATTRRGRRAGLGCAIEIAETLVLTVVIFFVIQTFVAQPFKVEMDSMQHTLEPDDYVLVDRLSPRWAGYSRGDVVVFNPPQAWTSRPEPYIKRVIGVGGDTVDVRDDGLVYVNGAALDERYLFADDAGMPEPTISGQTQWVVPDGELFVMGDHRQQSADSRVFGSIPIDSVVGRAFVRYWPLSVFGLLEVPST
jgi:signal peptidase I